MTHNATIYIADPSILGSRLFECFDDIKFYEGLSDGDNARGFKLELDWGTITGNFMTDDRLPEHLAGLEGFIREEAVDDDALVYALARHRYIRMAIGCVIDTKDESEDFLSFLFRFTSSLNALMFFYDRLYDFTGDAVASARDEEDEPDEP